MRSKRSGILTWSTYEEPVDSAGLLVMTGDAADINDEAVNPTFEVDSSIKSDVDHIMETFGDDWISHLDRDNRDSLGIFLCFQLTKQLNLGDTKAAELAAMMTGRSDKAVHECMEVSVL